MTFRRGAALAALITCVLMATPPRARGQTGPEAADAARPMPREDVLELFGSGPGDAGSVAHSPGAASDGQGLASGRQGGPPLELTPVGPAQERFHESESKPLKRPDGTGWLGGGRGPTDAGKEESAAHAGLGGGLWARVQNWLPLLTVLVVIALAAWGLRRFMPARRLLTGSGVLEIVARTPLSAKQCLILVKMGRQLVLLGVTAEQINALCVVDEPDQVATLLGEAASQGGESMVQAFSRAFEEESAAYSGEASEVHPAEEAGSEVRGLLDKIRRLKRGREVA